MAAGFLTMALIASISTCGAAEGADAGADTTAGYLEQLQQRDIERYDVELMEPDPALRDSALAVLDSLGIEGYRKLARLKVPPWDFNLGGAGQIGAYNRVEGLVIGLGAEIASNRRPGLRLRAQGAWATATGKIRYYGDLNVPVGRLGVFGGYADHVVPFGSNRITLNGLRAFVGGSDDQDYLREKGGWAGLGFTPSPWVSLTAAYTAADEESVRTRGVWSIFGDLDQPNAAADNGTMRAIELQVEAGSISTAREYLLLDYRIAGGGLGGDFTFTGLEASGKIRRYLVGGTEALLSMRYEDTGGSPPYQYLADEGGLSSVRGWERRALLGRSGYDARMEIYLPLDPLAWTHLPRLEDARIQIVPWGDAGRVWNGNSDLWITALGVGLQRYIGPFGSASNLRLDFAFPTGPSRPDDMHVYLWFREALF